MVEEESFPYSQNEAAILHAIVGFDCLPLLGRKFGVRNDDRLDEILPTCIVLGVNLG